MGKVEGNEFEFVFDCHIKDSGSLKYVNKYYVLYVPTKNAAHKHGTYERGKKNYKDEEPFTLNERTRGGTQITMTPRDYALEKAMDDPEADGMAVAQMWLISGLVDMGKHAGPDIHITLRDDYPDYHEDWCIRTYPADIWLLSIDSSGNKTELNDFKSIKKWAQVDDKINIGYQSLLEVNKLLLKHNPELKVGIFLEDEEER